MLRPQRPKLLIGSLECRIWISLQNLSQHKRPEGDLARRRVQEAVHLHFCADMYREQMKQGRYFVLEKPRFAASWKQRDIEELLEHKGVELVTGHMCAQGMEVEGPDGKAPVKKLTGWLTHSPRIARRMAQQCSNIAGKSEEHRHAGLKQGRAKQCEVYPRKRCRSILRGLREQLLGDGVLGLEGLGAVCQDPEENKNQRKIGEELCAREEQTYQVVRFYGDIRGEELDWSKVMQARRKGPQVTEEKPLYKVVARQESCVRTDRPLMFTKVGGYRQRWRPHEESLGRSPVPWRQRPGRILRSGPAARRSEALDVARGKPGPRRRR